MQLREGEQILKVYHHHPTPFVLDVLKAVVGAFPFFFLLYLFQPALSMEAFIYVNLGVFLIFALIITYLSLIYWLDKVIITNQRVIHIDWKYLTVRDEAEALLDDIQDVQTEEKGILAALWIFDYGVVRLDTPSSYVTIEFKDAPDPEGMRKFLFSIKKT